ncbi:MAG TPA: ABC transporter ATP-binding protein, partial [Bacteroidia bacterium]|nr:ABC transporter ATP-binding protein [Bacteroidia bacterium]
MPDSPIINITNLSCSYNLKQENKVLYIEDLKLERGKIIFLLGASGTGKSTLLEALGLMNNTIASGTVEFSSSKKEKYDFANLWQNNNEQNINSIRKNFLSFIFQNTNLMENFTAYENICLSQMIKGSSDQLMVMNTAEELMKQVRLPQNEVGYDTLSVNLSGGQRQRVSFVRALNSDYELLLCDEPTGNLDEVNAKELLQIVKQNLREDKTAVLVSHDVNLALKYADQIILITKNPQYGYGEILPKNIFQRDYWSLFDDKELTQFRDSIIELFLPVIRKNDAKLNEKKAVENVKKISYRDLFLKKEGRVLMGKSYLNLVILITIISITF